MKISDLSMLTDLYEFSMANGFQQALPNATGVFDIFFRRVPDQGSFVIFAGLEQVIDALSDLQYTPEDIDYLASLHIFNQDFLDYLANFKFECTITAIPEGTPVFPQEPLLTVEGPLIQAQLLETILLNILNHESLIATKARRIVHAASGRPVMEFGARRAQGPDAAANGARAALIGGCDSTSNVYAAEHFGGTPSGTMAHAWVEAFPNEQEAFDAWADLYPDNCALLVDTFDVLTSGLPHAIETFKKLRASGHEPLGIRIDSGDISYLTMESRRMLDAAGFNDVKITVSNSMDEHVIRTLLENDAPIDSFGVGENLITSASSPVLSGVYKLAGVEQNGVFTPKLKVSATRAKLTLPGLKRVYRLYNESGKAFSDVIALADESLDAPITVVDADPMATIPAHELTEFRYEPLQQTIFDHGKLVYTSPSIAEIKSYMQRKLDELWPETKRLINPSTYHVSTTVALKDLQTRLVQDHLEGQA
ncbi:nicotinate phosphoribosyltransferase [Levilactobacillus bambusae]|uniref:Nicotinate phosphoribosyltransferase n=1 Tax=Levilactobacillus bambusae TaxID=2024736 RepID=A0A2V1MY09_9LACO|nr:nicotinate phosphoribosyltransferase [Levilactobacillus bambusae]PWF99876.1 nicotinate phosphoribosyltransferase [Levilactobacillus bambusae]